MPVQVAVWIYVAFTIRRLMLLPCGFLILGLWSKVGGNG